MLAHKQIIANIKISVRLAHHAASNNNLIDLKHTRIRYDPRAKEKRTTPTAKALAHFDQYYGPYFGNDLWPSLRLALLSPSKYVGIVNNFCLTSDKTEQILEQKGACNIIPQIYERLSEYYKENNINTSMNSPSDSSQVSYNPLTENDSSTQPIATGRRFLVKEEDVASDRQDFNEFMPATQILSEHEMYLRSAKSNRMLITQESVLPIQDHSIIADDVIRIPHQLKVYAFDRGVVKSLGRPQYDFTRQSSFYPLDGGSILPVLALNVGPGDKVLDLCAAPGGKSLIMLQSLLLDQLMCVDSAGSRLSRLRDVLTTHAPVSYLEDGKVTLLQKDARRFNIHNVMEDGFNKVLADVPCSSDRHAVNDPETNIFSTGRHKERLQLPIIQHDILRSAILACQPGGDVVYSTCTLSPGQNAAVVESCLARLKEEQGISVAIVDLTGLVQAVQDTWFRLKVGPGPGVTVLPFLPNNYGPSYLCKMRRLN